MKRTSGASEANAVVSEANARPAESRFSFSKTRSDLYQTNIGLKYQLAFALYLRVLCSATNRYIWAIRPRLRLGYISTNK